MPQQTILIVDDSEVIRKLNEVHLKKAGYDVLLAENGRIGVKLAQTHTPDAIIMDVQMPEMDGYEATRLIRKMHATMHTPVIMLTSLSSLSNMQEGFDAGADDYLTKPFKPNELILKVSSVLRRVDRAQNATQDYETAAIAVFSLRGGAGCTSLATNLAVGLSQLWNKSTVLADLVTPVGVCDLLLDAKPSNNINTILSAIDLGVDSDFIRGCLTEHDTGINFLAGLRDPIQAELLTENISSLILDTIQEINDYTVLDLPHNFGAITLSVIDQVDHIIMPITPDVVSMRLAATCLQIFKSLGIEDDKVHIVVNWTYSESGLDTPAIEKYLNRKVLVTIPNLPTLFNRAMNYGELLIMLEDKEHPLVELLEDMAWKFSTLTDKSRIEGEHTDMRRRIARRLKHRKEYLEKAAARRKGIFGFGQKE